MAAWGGDGSDCRESAYAQPDGQHLTQMVGKRCWTRDQRPLTTGTASGLLRRYPSPGPKHVRMEQGSPSSRFSSLSLGVSVDTLKQWMIHDDLFLGCWLVSMLARLSRGVWDKGEHILDGGPVFFFGLDFPRSFSLQAKRSVLLLHTFAWGSSSRGTYSTIFCNRSSSCSKMVSRLNLARSSFIFFMLKMRGG